MDKKVAKQKIISNLHHLIEKNPDHHLSEKIKRDTRGQGQERGDVAGQDQETGKGIEIEKGEMRTVIGIRTGTEGSRREIGGSLKETEGNLKKTGEMTEGS